MEPALTSVLPGSLPDHGDITHVPPSAPLSIQPNPPTTEPANLFHSGNIAGSICFADVLSLLNQVHEAEVAALQGELEELHHERRKQAEGHGERAATKEAEGDHVPTAASAVHFQSVPSSRAASAIQVQNVFSDASAAQFSGMPSSWGVAQIQNVLSDTSAMPFQSVPSSRGASGMQIQTVLHDSPSSPSSPMNAMVNQASASQLSYMINQPSAMINASSVVGSMPLNPAIHLNPADAKVHMHSPPLSVNPSLRFSSEHPVSRLESSISQTLPIQHRSSLVHTLEFDVVLATADLKKWEHNWIKLVAHIHQHAQQHKSQLHEMWMVSADQVHSAAKANAVDLWAHACARKGKIRRKLAGGAKQYTGQNIPMERPDDGVVRRCLANFKSRISFLRQFGWRLFMERYYVATPHSGWRLAWVALGALLILYDVFVVPLQAFHYNEDEGLLNFMKWFQALFWTIDLMLTFVTAVYVDAELNYQLSIIARKYLTTWLGFDASILIAEWSDRLSLSSTGMVDMRAVRIIRLLRFFRLLRLAKLSSLFEQGMKALNSPSLSLILKLIQLVLGLIVFSHLNACLWYAVGEQEDGWTSQVASKETDYKYFTSLHWTLTQFQGTSEIIPGAFTGERVYAVCTVMVSLLILSAFLSNFTNIVMQIQALTVERDRQINELCKYMRAHRIPRQLSMRVRNYLDQATSDKNKVCDALKILPERLLIELEFEIYNPTISRHAFFFEFTQVFPRLSRRIFHYVNPSYMGPQDLVFSAQETAFFIYFVVSGAFDYAVILRCSDEALTLGRELVVAGATLGEPTLWMQWQHKGTFIAERFSEILMLSGEVWRSMVITHPPSHMSCSLYARRLIAGMARQYWKCTDIVDPAQMIIEEDQVFNALSQHYNASKQACGSS